MPHSKKLPVYCTGSLPQAWFGSGDLSAYSDYLNLSNNCLSGSIPTTAGGKFIVRDRTYGKIAPTGVIVDPMKKSFGLCGHIPSNMNIQSAQRGQLVGTCQQGHAQVCTPSVLQDLLSLFVRSYMDTPQIDKAGCSHTLHGPGISPNCVQS